MEHSVSGKSNVSFLEIGCGDGKRLSWLTENKKVECVGVDPSIKAIELLVGQGIEAKKGTADILPFDSGRFDIVVFGFCLYLCDRADLFQIAAEANRVLKPSGWLIIRDFYSDTQRAREYAHQPAVKSYKMDYRKLFTWHPNYECFKHKVSHHIKGQYCDDVEQWTSVSVLRKRDEGWLS